MLKILTEKIAEYEPIYTSKEFYMDFGLIKFPENMSLVPDQT